MLSEKAPAEELDAYNHKRPHKIVGKLLYYARGIDPTMLMALISLAEVQTKITIETKNKSLNFPITPQHIQTQ